MNNNKAKVITVYPLVSGNGANFIATNIANALKIEYGDKKKIALVDFDFKKPFLAHSLTEFDDVHGIDNLTDKIDGGVLTNELFLENMIQMKNNVSLLKGTKMLGKYRNFSSKHVATIIDILRDNYDFVVIAVSTETDNAGTVYGLNGADEVMIVIRNNETNARLFEVGIQKVCQYKKEDIPIKAMYNMFTPVSKVEFGRQMKEHNITVMGVVEYDENAVDNVNLINGGMKSLFKNKNKNSDVFTKAVKEM